MMMPANFSAIAENELVYVVGGSAATDWAKTFNTNMVTIVGNTYLGTLVNATLGTMFGGNWGGDGVSFGDAFKAGLGTAGMNGFNKVLQAVGIGAAVYNLGTASTKNYVAKPGKTDKTWSYDHVHGMWEYIGKGTEKVKNIFTIHGLTPTPVSDIM